MCYAFDRMSVSYRERLPPYIGHEKNQNLKSQVFWKCVEFVKGSTKGPPSYSAHTFLLVYYKRRYTVFYATYTHPLSISISRKLRIRCSIDSHYATKTPPSPSFQPNAYRRANEKGAFAFHEVLQLIQLMFMLSFPRGTKNFASAAKGIAKSWPSEDRCQLFDALVQHCRVLSAILIPSIRIDSGNKGKLANCKSIPRRSAALLALINRKKKKKCACPIPPSSMPRDNLWSLRNPFLFFKIKSIVKQDSVYI